MTRSRASTTVAVPADAIPGGSGVVLTTDTGTTVTIAVVVGGLELRGQVGS